MRKIREKRIHWVLLCTYIFHYILNQLKLLNRPRDNVILNLFKKKKEKKEADSVMSERASLKNYNTSTDFFNAHYEAS